MLSVRKRATKLLLLPDAGAHELATSDVLYAQHCERRRRRRGRRGREGEEGSEEGSTFRARRKKKTEEVEQEQEKRAAGTEQQVQKQHLR